MAQDTMRLVLIRHGESEWNKENLFTGWADVDLSELGRDEAYNGGVALKDAGFDFDLCYTSYLKRAIHTLNLVLDAMDRDWLPVEKTWKLNERHYGALQGLNKADTAAKYGDDQVKVWRRSFDVRPPALEPGDERDAHTQPAYRDVPADQIPYAECLEDTIARVWPWFQEVVEPQMRAGKRIVIAAHGNSLRALVKQFDGLTPDEILEVNIPTAIPLVYTFDRDFNVVDKQYVGDPEVIAAKIDAVANQGKAKG
ncbi:2,3-diphosphoglycerate-dependent phosphoglycerate mutase [Granulimonas faecalis]|uniref:2,3-bisphosphoglycerate-dependent phosphoglycerate mutase n=1 Tax=Granulimonas faecalis TaxID=2894155 RepID=A0AAV5B6B5_9ACTN|nr:2,3-diphosphoglycerate-dependent phosphoglycerate mutase [Granulimonas faecalis]MBF0599518.1 2,3-diphosphoglycerate-dependent phosphoglycerate mutase [Atopobiaceae bacterium FL090493]GJM55788.1 2,3-bisphosphoglycerate-dependent phosphoglycerate mutase [Granulimonas faecalis]